MQTESKPSQRHITKYSDLRQKYENPLPSIGNKPANSKKAKLIFVIGLFENFYLCLVKKFFK